MTNIEEDYRKYLEDVSTKQYNEQISVSNNIIDKIEINDLTLEDIHKKTNMSYKKIRYYLQDNNLNEYDRLLLICNVMGITLSQLFTKSDFHKSVAEKSYGNPIIARKKVCLQLLKNINDEKLLKEIIENITNARMSSASNAKR